MKQVIILLLFPFLVKAQWIQPSINPQLFENRWDAKWITHPDFEGTAYGVYHGRKTFNLSQVPDQFLIHVSADNRYRLYVNEIPVAFGPARGDIWHWRYESVDISKHLKTGKNVLAIIFINFGEYRPLSQHSYKTAFIVQGNTESEAVVNTGLDSGWKVYRNPAYYPIKIDWRHVNGFFAAGPADSLLTSLYPWNWESIDYNDSQWKQPGSIGYNGSGIPYEYHRFSGNSAWKLIPRNIPPMEESVERFREIENDQGSSSKNFLSGSENLVINRDTTVRILFDMSYLTKGYPELVFHDGKEAMIRITYAESLIDEDGNKGNRNEIRGKHIFGYHDVIRVDGGKNRRFRPLWIRTFRYVEIEIITQAEPLIIKDFYNVYTGYPFQKNAYFRSDDESLSRIFDIGWRTLRMCADETYWDCPYYEQLQYAGDTRTQTFISQYVSGDDRLFQNALLLFDHSRISEGPTYSRYPSYIPQVTPAYSLMWINMIYDYLMMGKDPSFTDRFLPGITSVLNFYESYIDSTGMIGELPFTNHVESKSAFPWEKIERHIAQHSLLYAYTLRNAAVIFNYFGHNDTGKKLLLRAGEITKATRKNCYDPQRRLFADTPDKTIYSQHVNTLAILADAVDEGEQRFLMDKILNDTTLLPSYLFFKFYVFRALKETGMGDLYLDQLDHWKNLLSYGFTTWPEFDLESRSDCHAWSAHPTFDLLSIVSGIESAAPGFKRISITPHLGDLRFVESEMPHPKGKIYVHLTRKSKSGLVGKVILPEGIKGVLNWNGKSYQLLGGEQSFQIE